MISRIKTHHVNISLINTYIDKCGIIIFEGSETRDSSCSGINYVKDYKYLGTKRNENLNPITHIKNNNERLNLYIQKNYRLRTCKFSIKTLKCIYMYWMMRSRLIYNMEWFMDNNFCMQHIDKKNTAKLFKEILKLGNYRINRCFTW